MIYISDYELKPRKKDGRLHVVNRGTEPVCPICGRILQYRDERSRVYKREVGERNVLYVRRLYCRYCKTYLTAKHTMLSFPIFWKRTGNTRYKSGIGSGDTLIPCDHMSK